MKKLFLKAWRIAFERKWDKVFIAVDIHDVILQANYKAGAIPKEFLGKAKEVLQRLSTRKDVCLILYTCSFPNEIKEYLAFFEENDIHFKYVNENLDCPNTAFGCFDKKFYYQILLEDKAGFNPEDWEEIDEALDYIDAAKIVEITKANKKTYWYRDIVGKQLLVLKPTTSYYKDFFVLMEENEDKAIHYKDCNEIGQLDLTKFTQK